jgi:hypothetical protein
MAAICAGVRKLSERIPPLFELIAFWICAALLPFLLVPWHPVQYCW